MSRLSARVRRLVAPNGPAGFTLVEIVVVIVILGVVAAVSVPALSDLNRPDPLRDGTANVVRVLERARATARVSGRHVAITIDPLSARFWLNEPPIAGNFDLVDGVTLWSDEARPRITFGATGTGTADRLVVQWRGTASVIFIDAFTGEVRTDAR